MIVKKFQGETEKDAILKAQEELGNNAVVLNVKTIKQRGILKLFKKDVVEVTAALEEEELSKKANTGAKEFGKAFEASSYAGNMHKQPDISSRPAGGLNLLADEKISVSSESAVIEQKLDSLHSLLQSQINAGASRKNSMQVDDEKERDDIAAERIAGKKAVEERENANMKFIRLIYKKLVDNEVNEKFADEIMADIENSLKRESNIDSILSAVYQKIILKLGEPKPIELGDKPKVVFFIGPTGVGKTTTIAKIASKYKVDYEKKVAFITADTYRIAATEQLQVYANILDAPMSIVYSKEELNEAIGKYAEYDLVFVDTAGFSHKNEEQKEDIRNLIQGVDPEYTSEVYLVLSATTKYRDLLDIVDTYHTISEFKLIFTKLDETSTYGNLLNIKLYSDAELSYTTNGQNVPDDIELFDTQKIVKQLLGGNS